MQESDLRSVWKGGGCEKRILSLCFFLGGRGVVETHSVTFIIWKKHVESWLVEPLKNKLLFSKEIELND